MVRLTSFNVLYIFLGVVLGRLISQLFHNNIHIIEVKEMADRFDPCSNDHQVKNVINDVQIRSEKQLSRASLKNDNNKNYRSKQITKLNSNCVKRKNIAFMKVHKCGSTTVSNILQRFGLRHDLNFVLPDKPHDKHFWVLGDLTHLTKKQIIPLPIGQVYNILAVDTFFNSTVYHKLIPNDAFLLAIVREPVSRYVSMEYYEGRAKILHERFGTDPYIFAGVQNKSNTDERSALQSMMSDFGQQQRYRNDDQKVQEHLQYIDKQFDFVIVMEYFDESLILLKRKLCWKTKDIVYIISNRNTWDKINYVISPKQFQIIQYIQQADYKLYTHFRHKLERQILKAGEDLFEEVHNFRLILKLVFGYCTHQEGPDELIIPASIWNEEFGIDRGECDFMLQREFPLVKKLQERQWKIYQNSIRS